MGKTVNQRTRYLLPTGDFVADRNARRNVDSGTIAELARAETSKIPPGFIVGIAERETNRDGDGGCPNQVDQDIDADGNAYHTTYGLFQIDAADAALALVLFNPLNPAPSLCDPGASVKVFASVLRRNQDALAAAANLDLERVGEWPSDFWAYLAWSHNQNLTAAVKGVKKYGLNWQAMKDRNAAELDANPSSASAAYVVDRLGPYADYCIARIAQFPFADSSSSSSSSSVDDPAAVSTLVGSFEPYELRKLAVAVALGLALYVVWRILR